MAERILIFDTTLRDGEQSPGCSMNLEEKLRMAGQLEALGVDVIEAGFPIASDDDFRAVREVSKKCQRASVAALSRALPADIERAWEALGKRGGREFIPSWPLRTFIWSTSSRSAAMRHYSRLSER